MKRSIYQKLFFSLAIVAFLGITVSAQVLTRDQLPPTSDKTQNNGRVKVATQKVKTSNSSEKVQPQFATPTRDAVGIGISTKVLEDNRAKIQRIHSTPLFANIQQMSDEELLSFIEENKNNAELTDEQKEYLMEVKTKIQTKLNRLNDKSKNQ